MCIKICKFLYTDLTNKQQKVALSLQAYWKQKLVENNWTIRIIIFEQLLGNENEHISMIYSALVLYFLYLQWNCTFLV